MSIQKSISLVFHRFRSLFYCTDNSRQTIADLCRHLILSWLLAVTVEYLRLPAVIRSLEYKRAAAYAVSGT